MYFLHIEDWYSLTKDFFGGCGCDMAEFGQKGVWHTPFVDKQAAYNETVLLSQNHSYDKGQETETDVSSLNILVCGKIEAVPLPLFLFM